MSAVRGVACAAGAFAVTLLATACASQIAALAPVGGDDVTAVRNAAIDVVTANQILLKQAPVCADDQNGYTCVGATTDGLAVTATAPPDGLTLTVAVGDRVLYAGSLQAVLDAAVRGEPLPSSSPAGESG